MLMKELASIRVTWDEAEMISNKVPSAIKTGLTNKVASLTSQPIIPIECSLEN